MVPAQAVTIVNATKNPNFSKFVKEDEVSTRKPNPTEKALKVMAFPVILMPSSTQSSGPFVINPYLIPFKRWME